MRIGRSVGRAAGLTKPPMDYRGLTNFGEFELTTPFASSSYQNPARYKEHAERQEKAINERISKASAESLRLNTSSPRFLMMEREPVDACLLDPITGEVFDEPVVASDGFTYEKASLQNLFDTFDDPKSPVTGQVLDIGVMVPNNAIMQLLNARRPSSTCTKISKSREIPSVLNCRISSNLDDLDRLHAEHPWIPNSGQIRPTPETLARKAQYFAEVIPQYESERDFILHTIFGMPSIEKSGKLAVIHPRYVLRPHSLRVTKTNMFPYNLPHQTLHFVHWVYPHFDANTSLDERETNRAIKSHLDVYFGPRASYEFVWDVNPKMSLPHQKTGMMHIHVFAKILGSS